MAKAITEQPGLGEIPINLLVRILPSLIETLERNKAGRRRNSSVEGDVETAETGILSGSMADNETSDMGVPAMEAPSVQLPISSSPIVQPEQSPLIVRFQSVPADSKDSCMGISAVIPTIQFPDWYPTMNIPSDVGSAESALPTCTHLEEPLSAVSDGQGSFIESGSVMGEARTDSESIDRFIDEILDGSLERFINFECLERV
jgi:hypothetical protein